jgi:hypothetical protein
LCGPSTLKGAPACPARALPPSESVSMWSGSATAIHRLTSRGSTMDSGSPPTRWRHFGKQRTYTGHERRRHRPPHETPATARASCHGRCSNTVADSPREPVNASTPAHPTSSWSRPTGRPAGARRSFSPVTSTPRPPTSTRSAASASLGGPATGSPCWATRRPRSPCSVRAASQPSWARQPARCRWSVSADAHGGAGPIHRLWLVGESAPVSVRRPVVGGGRSERAAHPSRSGSTMTTPLL